MSVRPQIPAVEGVQDRQVAVILGPIKAILEKMTGRTPNAAQLQTLGASSTIGGVISKVNEVINRLQDAPAIGGSSGQAEAQDLSVAKAWVSFDGSGATASIISSYNVASITDNGTGDWTINFKIPFKTVNYAASISGKTSDGSVNRAVPAPSISNAPTTGQFSIQMRATGNGSGTAPGSAFVTVVFYGAQ